MRDIKYEDRVALWVKTLESEGVPRGDHYTVNGLMEDIVRASFYLDTDMRIKALELLHAEIGKYLGMINEPAPKEPFDADQVIETPEPKRWTVKTRFVNRGKGKPLPIDPEEVERD